MGVAFESGGAPAIGTTSVAPECPATVNQGDLLVLIVFNKYPNNGPATPAGWTLGIQGSGGSGSAGADAGDVYATLFWRVANGTEGGAAVTVAIASGNVAAAKINRYSKTAGAWVLEFAKGESGTPGTSWSALMDATFAHAVGDIIVMASGVNGDAYTYSAQALTATDVVYTDEVEVAENGIPTGDDLGWVLSHHVVEEAGAAAAATYTMTASGTAGDAPAGATVGMRISLSPGGGGTTEHAYVNEHPTLTEVCAEMLEDSVIQAGIDSPASAAWGVEFAAIKAARQAAGVWVGVLA